MPGWLPVATWTGAVDVAHDIGAVPVGTPTAVLASLDDGSSPHEGVAILIREAMAVAAGRFQGLGRLADLVETGDEEQRITPLDPQRPAPGLLEGVLSGI